MSKLKAIAIFIIAIIFVAMGVSIQILSKNLKQERADKQRLWNNNLELSSANWQYQKLVYTKDEFIKIMTDSLKKTLDSLEIKPKSVTKVVTREIRQEVNDTTPVSVIKYNISISKLGLNQWLLNDVGPCFTWSGIATLRNDSLFVKRTHYSNDNRADDYYYQDRKHKFLGIRFGKKEVKQVTVPKCGKATERIIEIIK